MSWLLGLPEVAMLPDGSGSVVVSVGCAVVGVRGVAEPSALLTGSAWACRGATLRRSTVDNAPAARVRDNVMVDLEGRGDEGRCRA